MFRKFLREPNTQIFRKDIDGPNQIEIRHLEKTLMDQQHYLLLKTAIKWRFKCIIRELKQTDAAAERRRSHSNLHSIQE